jgi:hypothetical protein
MSDEKIVPFPQAVSEEERARRIMTEARRLANGARGEWKLWYKGKAEDFGIEPEQFAELILAQIEYRNQKAAEKLAQDRLQEQRAERERKIAAENRRAKKDSDTAAARTSKLKAKTFRDIVKLPSDQHDAKLRCWRMSSKKTLTS